MPKTMKTKKLYFLFLALLTCVIYVGIQEIRRNSVFIPAMLSAPIHASFDFGVVLQELNAKNISDLEDIQTFSTTDGGKVLKVTLLDDGGYVASVNESGFLNIFRVKEKQTYAQYDVGPVHPSALNFSANGEKLLTPYSITADNKFVGAVIWEAKTGKILFCNGRKEMCPEENDLESSGEAAYFMDATGEWLYGYTTEHSTKAYWSNSFGVADQHIYGLDKYYDENLVHTDSVYLDTEKYFNDPNAEVISITTDSSAEYIAYAYANGVVRFSPWFALPTYEDMSSIHELTYEQARQSERIDVIDMKIDNTRRWLAVLNNKELLIWDLQRGKTFPLALRKNIRDGVALYFDQGGNLLALAQKVGISFYDLDSAREIVSVKTEGITSLYMSPDNRLLVWGDEYGDVHLFGVPQK